MKSCSWGKFQIMGFNYEDCGFSTVGAFVDASYNLSSQMPTDEEKAVKCEAWSRALMGVIPENRLQETFNRAFVDHTSNFPVSAYDLKTAWERIVADTERKTKEAIEARALAPSSEAELLCRRCDGSGIEVIVSPDGEYRGHRPGCSHRIIEDGDSILAYFAGRDAESLRMRWDNVFASARRDAVRMCDQLMFKLVNTELESEDNDEKSDLIDGKALLFRVRRHLVQENDQ